MVGGADNSTVDTFSFLSASTGVCTALRAIERNLDTFADSTTVVLSAGEGVACEEAALATIANEDALVLDATVAGPAAWDDWLFRFRSLADFRQHLRAH